jgi:hypothetical protein
VEEIPGGRSVRIAGPDTVLIDGDVSSLSRAETRVLWVTLGDVLERMDADPYGGPGGH